MFAHKVFTTREKKENKETGEKQTLLFQPSMLKYDKVSQYSSRAELKNDVSTVCFETNLMHNTESFLFLIFWMLLISGQ
jgi:hypothetical protein